MKKEKCIILLHDVSKIINFIKTENILVASRGGREGNGRLLSNGSRVSPYEMVRAVDKDAGYSNTAM